VAKACAVIAEQTDARFVDINMGCPIDSICNKGMGAMLMGRPARICELVRAASAVLRPRGVLLSVKLRMSVEDRNPVAHKIVPALAGWGAALCTLHGRSRQQRYSRMADWDYIGTCAAASSVPLIGNGDVFSHEDLAAALARPTVATVMVARGALIKPWLFTELQERRHWDISATERLDIMKRFAHFGLEHWGSVRARRGPHRCARVASVAWPALMPARAPRPTPSATHATYHRLAIGFSPSV
jgi:tRNA-dihydrouridine synthase 3